jgi:tetratricopeptide (TPR) repeat protein
MASQDSNNSEPPKPDRSRRFPDDKQRKRLQKLFEAASKQDSLEKYDYATDLYAQCVHGDPGNYDYLRSLVTVLQKKYGSVKKIPMAWTKARPERTALKKAVATCDWDEALQQGIDVLLVNPWDVPTLTQMATACGGIFKEEGLADKGNFGTYGDCELYYLKCAFDTFPRDKPDIEVCIQLAEALKKRDRFLEAISFWHKVEVLRPDDELPKREIATLTVLLHQSRDTKFEGDHKKSISSNTGAKTEEVSHEDRVAQRIKRNPNDIAAYDELINLHLNADHFDKAIEVLNQKLVVTNNDVQVQEAIEDVYLKALRSKWIAADAKAKKSGKEADAKEVQAIRAELVDKELQTYRNRCARYPNNLAFRFELGRRYMLNGNIPEAIKELQVAKSDPRKRGVCMMHLGDCFYHIKQYALAMTHYEHAIQDIPDRDQDNKKKSLFKAGTLSLGLKDLVRADKFLTTLASMDYTYPRISERLEQLKRMKDEADGKKPLEDKRREPPIKRPEEEEDEAQEDE